MAFTTLGENELFLMSVKDTLRDKVFEILKKPLMELAEREINKEVKKAVDEMNVALESYYEPQYMRSQINILYKESKGG